MIKDNKMENNYKIIKTNTGRYSVVAFGEVIVKVNSYRLAMEKVKNIKDYRKQEGFADN